MGEVEQVGQVGRVGQVGQVCLGADLWLQTEPHHGSLPNPACPVLTGLNSLFVAAATFLLPTPPPPFLTLAPPTLPLAPCLPQPEVCLNLNSLFLRQTCGVANFPLAPPLPSSLASPPPPLFLFPVITVSFLFSSRQPIHFKPFTQLPKELLASVNN